MFPPEQVNVFVVSPSPYTKPSIQVEVHISRSVSPLHPLTALLSMKRVSSKHADATGQEWKEYPLIFTIKWLFKNSGGYRKYQHFSIFQPSNILLHPVNFFTHIATVHRIHKASFYPHITSADMNKEGSLCFQTSSHLRQLNTTVTQINILCHRSWTKSQETPTLDPHHVYQVSLHSIKIMQVVCSMSTKLWRLKIKVISVQ